MSRSLNVNATEADVVATCAHQKAPISAIETLRSGGTRVVLQKSDDVARVTKAFRGKLLTGPVTRMPTRLLHG